MNEGSPVSPSNDEFIKQLGWLLIGFSNLDQTMNNTIWSLLGGSMVAGNAVTSEISSIPGRLRLIEKLSLELLGEDKKSEVLNITKEIEKINIERNNYIHSMWAKSGTPPDLHLITLNFKKSKIPYENIEIPTLEELKKLIERITKSSEALTNLIIYTIQPARERRRH